MTVHTLQATAREARASGDERRQQVGRQGEGRSKASVVLQLASGEGRVNTATERQRERERDMGERVKSNVAARERKQSVSLSLSLPTSSFAGDRSASRARQPVTSSRLGWSEFNELAPACAPFLQNEKTTIARRRAKGRERGRCIFFLVCVCVCVRAPPLSSGEVDRRCRAFTYHFKLKGYNTCRSHGWREERERNRNQVTRTTAVVARQ